MHTHTQPGGGATPRFWTPTPPPTNCWPGALGGGGGGGGIGGGVQGGAMGGGGLGGAGGGALREGRLRLEASWGGGGAGVVGVLGPAESPPP